jgi:hypothetical protein
MAISRATMCWKIEGFISVPFGLVAACLIAATLSLYGVAESKIFCRIIAVAVIFQCHRNVCQLPTQANFAKKFIPAWSNVIRALVLGVEVSLEPDLQVSGHLAD